MLVRVRAGTTVFVGRVAGGDALQIHVLKTGQRALEVVRTWGL